MKFLTNGKTHVWNPKLVNVMYMNMVTPAQLTEEPLANKLSLGRTTDEVYDK